MKAIYQALNGIVYEENGRRALLLDEAAAPVYLRFALVRMGTEEQILPAFLLDDWGTKVRRLALYEWIREYGEQFPRAEVFGYELDGSETQLFLRELELYMKYPCYVYPAADTPVDQGQLLSVIVRVDPLLTAPQQEKRPVELARPLRAADVQWWRIPPDDRARFQFRLLENSE